MKIPKIFELPPTSLDFKSKMATAQCWWFGSLLFAGSIIACLYHSHHWFGHSQSHRKSWDLFFQVPRVSSQSGRSQDVTRQCFTVGSVCQYGSLPYGLRLQWFPFCPRSLQDAGEQRTKQIIQVKSKMERNALMIPGCKLVWNLVVKRHFIHSQNV